MVMPKLPNARAVAMVPAAVMSLALPFTAHEEGLRTKAYLDSVGVATICYGETDGVKMGDVKTEKECGVMFNIRLGFFAYMIDIMVEPDMRPEFHAALTSWSYNVGLGAAEDSTLVRLANLGKMREACEQLPRWKLAGGKPILAARRERERQLCLKGV